MEIEQGKLGTPLVSLRSLTTESLEVASDPIANFTSTLIDISN